MYNNYVHNFLHVVTLVFYFFCSSSQQSSVLYKRQCAEDSHFSTFTVVCWLSLHVKGEPTPDLLALALVSHLESVFHGFFVINDGFIFCH